MSDTAVKTPVKGNAQQGTPSAKDLDAKLAEDARLQAAGEIPEQETVKKFTKRYAHEVRESLDKGEEHI